MCVRPARLEQKLELGLTVPCGQCIECRLRRSREWAIRCMHEASLYDANSFITLTYADEFLPKGGSLDRRAFPLFMKRLRKVFGSVRYFHAGEYGEKNGRPHYHALLFGLRFADERECGRSQSGFPVFESAALSALWTHGSHQVGRVSFESAQYVARYCLTSCSKEQAAAARATGFEPEYGTMSRGNGIPGHPNQFGIGSRWLKEFRGDVYRDDFVVRGGHEMSPPRYYDKKEEELDEGRMEVVRARRLRKHGARCTVANGYTWRTNAAREVIAVARLKQLEEARR